MHEYPFLHTGCSPPPCVSAISVSLHILSCECINPLDVVVIAAISNLDGGGFLNEPEQERLQRIQTPANANTLIELLRVV